MCWDTLVKVLCTCMQAQPWVLLPLGLPSSAQRVDPIIHKNSLNSIQTRVIIRPNRHLFKTRLPAYRASVGRTEGKEHSGRLLGRQNSCLTSPKIEPHRNAMKLK